jgi:hypothetical protein
MASVEMAAPRAAPGWWRPQVAEVAVAVVAFAALCVAALVRSRSPLEPDDFAYRASIVALSHGHLTLSSSQYEALSSELGSIMQWVQLPSGRWISEKNPGYPFLALPFGLLGALRLAPLFYGALGCIGLFFGGRRWLGRFGGAWAVAFYCSSGAAMLFAWRATMPTFTDASLVAAGTGALLWTLLAEEASTRRRAVVGVLGFLALEAATFVRYTNGVVLLVALATAGLSCRRTRIEFATLAVWVASALALAALVLGFDSAVYGGATKTGYGTDEITFALWAVMPNIEHIPRHLVSAMPVIVLALAACVWIAVRAVRGARGDAAVGLGLFASWAGIYGVYVAYTWTAHLEPHGGTTLQVVRFYVPALGAIALLAAWLAQRFPRWVPLVVVAAAVTLGIVSYGHLAHDGFGDPGPGRPALQFGGDGSAPPPPSFP